MSYRGRFAPTPSGPLHLGSLSTALASFLQARAAGGEWLLRIDDLDRARCRAEHSDTILQQLEAHGLHWDAAPRFQHQHIEQYEAAFERLRVQGLLYGCSCTRARLSATSHERIDGPVYAGACRGQSMALDQNAVRLHVEAITLEIADACQGTLRRQLDREVGDFVVRRSDGEIAYQLACTIDEDAQRITEVVRGADLIGSTFRQRYLQLKLELPQPAYVHVPILFDAQGHKMSKQNHAPAIAADRAAANLIDCLQWLGQRPPIEIRQARVDEILRWAIGIWNIQRIDARSVPAAGAERKAW